jgi:hypothetical protein
MARGVRITIHHFGDTDETAESFDTQGFVSTADRVAFERRFMGMGEMAEKLAEDPDNMSVMREEHVAFFVWRAASRTLTAYRPFDEWVETIESIEIEDLDKKAVDAEDPTQAPPSGS